MMNKYVTYVLYSYKSERLYIGQTDNIERRLKEHDKGKVRSTKPYLPYRLIYSETFTKRVDAVQREKELKRTDNRRLLRKLI